MISAVFNIGAFDIAVWIIYFIMIIAVMTISYFEYDNKEKDK